jgi:hypothetical protein
VAASITATWCAVQKAAKQGPDCHCHDEIEGVHLSECVLEVARSMTTKIAKAVVPTTAIRRTGSQPPKKKVMCSIIVPLHSVPGVVGQQSQELVSPELKVFPPSLHA